MESVITYSKMELEKNNFEKENYTFCGWKVYNNRTKKYSCKEGWYTEEEIKENNYTIEYLTTEEMKEKVNSVRGNSFTITAQWSKEEIEPVIDLEEKEIEPVINLEEKKEKAESRKEKRPCEKHNYELISETKETCTENGRKEYKCKDCDKERIEIIKSKGHEWVKKEEIAGTCKREGKIIEECTKCKETRETLTEKGDHNYEEKIIKEATSKEEGLKEIICTECGDRKEEVIEKLPISDLEILEENLEGENLEEKIEELFGETEEEISVPVDFIINDITIKITGDMYIKENEEVIFDIIYNNKHYSMFIDPESFYIIDIKENDVKTEFRYGKKYISENNNENSIIIEENGNIKSIYNGSEYTRENYVFIYRNNLYILEEQEGGFRYFEWMANISEDGTYFNNNEEIFILEEKYDEVKEELEKEREEEFKNLKGYYEGSTYNNSGEKGSVGFITIPAEKMGDLEYDYFVYMTLSRGEEDGYGGISGLIVSGLLNLQMRVGTYEFRMTNGEVKTLRNPVFRRDGLIGPKWYCLYGYFPDANTFIPLEAELDPKLKIEDGKIYYNNYSKINKSYVELTDYDESTHRISKFTKKTFKEVEMTNLYFNDLEEEQTSEIRTFVGFNEKGIYIGTYIDGYLLPELGARKYTIRENYIKDLGDGEVEDYTGKRVIVLEEDLYKETSGLRKGDVIGYLENDGNKLILESNIGIGENFTRVKNEGQLNEVSEPQTVEIDTQEINEQEESLVSAPIEEVELKEENQEELVEEEEIKLEDIKEETESEEKVESKIETEELTEEIKEDDEINTELEESTEKDVLEKEENLEE